MSMTRDEYRDLTRQFLTEGLSEQAQPSQYGRTESGDPQSYAEFAQRLDAITRLVEELTMDYVDSNWLADGDHGSLAADVDKLFLDTDKLSMAATGLAQSMGEI